MIRKKTSRFCTLSFLAIILLFSAPISGSSDTDKKITFAQAYEDAEPLLLKPLCQILSWLDDQHFLLNEKDERQGRSVLFRVNALTGEKVLFLDFGKIQGNLPDGLKASQPEDHTEDYTHLLYLCQDDLYCFSSENDTLKRLTFSTAAEKTPKFSPDGRFVAFTRENDLYSLDIATGREHRLTEDGCNTVYNGWASWVYFEEIQDETTEYRSFWWSPDSKKIAFLRFDDGPVPQFPLFKSEGPHGKLLLTRYPKSGDPNPFVKLGVVSAEGGEIVWADCEEKADHYLAFPAWTPDSSELAFQWMNREQDNIKVYMMNIRTGAKEKIYDEKQPTWVEFFPDLTFLKNRNGFLLRSDKSGWWQLYSYDLKGNLKHRITRGEWPVTSISLVDEKNQRVYLHARMGNTAETQLFRVNLDGTGLMRLTRRAGSHKGYVSPRGSHIIDEFSNTTEPSRIDLLDGDGLFLRNICHSRTPLMEEYHLGKKQLFTIPTQDGLSLPAFWILPPDFDEDKKYPVLFLAYGGPDRESDRVTESYPTLSELYLSQEGIIVFSVDHRGTGHFCKRGASLMHRNLGKWEVDDLIEAVKWLHKKPFVDRTKIGVTGRSYGGYTTCMALTRGADYFTHGYARFPVTDWRLYDTVYTERYMDRPGENREGYEFSSVLTHAHKLKGVLHLSHSDLDDNVHLQNTVQLISCLMDLEKKFSFMLYPEQAHTASGKKKIHLFRHYIDFWLGHFIEKPYE